MLRKIELASFFFFIVIYFSLIPLSDHTRQFSDSCNYLLFVVYMFRWIPSFNHVPSICCHILGFLAKYSTHVGMNFHRDQLVDVVANDVLHHLLQGQWLVILVAADPHPHPGDLIVFVIGDGQIVGNKFHSN